MSRPLIDYLVLDAVADDFESLELVVESVNSNRLTTAAAAPIDFSVGEVAVSVGRCIREGLVQAYSPRRGTFEPLGDRVVPHELESCWFGSTPQGRATHESWRV